jgi:helix-turn-helix protein
MLKQTDAARMIGISYSTLQNNEAGQYPNQNNLQKSINFYKCSKDWLLTGQEPVYQNPDEFTETVGINRDKKNYDNYDNMAGPGVGHKVDRDDFGKAVSGLKEIFDSVG